MGKGKNLTTAKKQKIRVDEEISTLEISKVLYRDHLMTKKAVENVIKLMSKEKALRTCFFQDERKLK